MQTMKAMIINNFGSVDTLLLADLPIPTPAAGEILIKISHAGVNPVDWKIREGYLKDLFPHKFPLILGWDAAGTVAAVGTGVKKFNIGDRVYAYARKPVVQGGTYAEFTVVEAAHAAIIPQQLDSSEASAIPLTALTAWQGLFDFANLRANQTVLIHAGAGGVGSFAIQFAKIVGAKVITTATQAKHEYLRSLGADVTIDYTSENFRQVIKAQHPEGIDVVFDSVGGETMSQSFEVLKTGGTLVSIVDTPNSDIAAKYSVKAGFVFVAPNGDQLRQIGELFGSNKLKLPKIKVMALDEAKAALSLSQSHRTTGKIVLAV